MFKKLLSVIMSLLMLSVVYPVSAQNLDDFDERKNPTMYSGDSVTVMDMKTYDVKGCLLGPIYRTHRALISRQCGVNGSVIIRMGQRVGEIVKFETSNDVAYVKFYDGVPSVPDKFSWNRLSKGQKIHLIRDRNLATNGVISAEYEVRTQIGEGVILARRTTMIMDSSELGGPIFNEKDEVVGVAAGKVRYVDKTTGNILEQSIITPMYILS